MSYHKDLGTYEGVLKTLVTRCPDLYELEMRTCLNNWWITTHCIKLSSLRLCNLGLNGILEQSYIGRFDNLLDALSSCPKLQRVYLSIVNNTDKLMEETVMTFLKRTNKLLFFGVCLRKRLFNSHLQSRVNNWVRKSLGESRPTPVVVFVPIYPDPHPDTKDYLADVPAVHLMEMVKNLSGVCLPFSQKDRYFFNF
uniref:Uncharacterized protein n=1 Tax=Timema cristinae TaxID=61476 RepID=A0A7R9DCB4_TIMCR|nr:unnamed protein product [Timema cristinae]